MISIWCLVSKKGKQNLLGSPRPRSGTSLGSLFNDTVLFKFKRRKNRLICDVYTGLEKNCLRPSLATVYCTTKLFFKLLFYFAKYFYSSSIFNLLFHCLLFYIIVYICAIRGKNPHKFYLTLLREKNQT